MRQDRRLAGAMPGFSGKVFGGIGECAERDRIVAAVSQGVVAGFGVAGYALALRGLKDLLAAKK